MKSRVARNISALLILTLAAGSVAQAAAPVQPEIASFEEVSEAEAQAQGIEPPTDRFWNEYATVGGPQTESFDVGTIIIGTIAIDAIVNIGKSIWTLIQAGKPQINLDMNVASAVPQGIQSWAELDSWKDPIAKLYKTQLYTGNKRYLGDVYYRLVFTYGGHYRGIGNYLTNVTILPAQISVSYNKNFYAQTKVSEIVNHGTRANPIAGMTLDLIWGVESLTSKSMQSISLHVRGDGGVTVLPGPDEQAQTVNAPVTKVPKTAPTPVATLAPTPVATPTPKPSYIVIPVRIIPGPSSTSTPAPTPRPMP